jgi:Na+(H+)/acetate symporter ActP
MFPSVGLIRPQLRSVRIQFNPDSLLTVCFTFAAFHVCSFRMPDITKDVVIALLGSSVSFAGLLLIFSGFLFAQASSFPATTNDELIDRYRNAGRWGLLPFLMALAVTALAFVWMVHPSPCFYRATLVGFAFLIATSAFYGAFMLIGYL